MSNSLAGHLTYRDVTYNKSKSALVLHTSLTSTLVLDTSLQILLYCIPVHFRSSRGDRKNVKIYNLVLRTTYCCCVVYQVYRKRRDF